MDMTAALFKSVASLTAIVAGIYGIVWLFRRVSGGRSRLFGLNGVIEVLGSRHIGPKACLSIVKVGERYLLLGVSDAHVSMITELSGAEVPSGAPTGGGGPERRVAPPGGAAGLLSWIGSLRARGEVPVPEGESLAKP